MIIIGMTGSIGMGKSTLASQLALFGAKISSADQIVHRMMAVDGEAVPLMEQYFPAVVENGSVNRRRLGDIVFSSEEKRLLLEQLIHPLVAKEEERFISKERRKGASLMVLDIPLLFETGAEDRCDYVIVASAPKLIQRQRVLSRPHMTEARLSQILAQQMPDAEKCARADFVVQTGLGKAYSFRKLKRIMRELGHA